VSINEEHFERPALPNLCAEIAGRSEGQLYLFAGVFGEVLSRFLQGIVEIGSGDCRHGFGGAGGSKEPGPDRRRTGE